MLLVLRVALGLLALIAIRRQFAVHLQHGFPVQNFFSYFTNFANLFAAIVFLYGALRILRRRQPSSAFDLARGMAVVNMTVVGVVFAALLRNEDLGTLLPWVNFVLHTAMPCAVVLEWMLWPPQAKLGWKQVGLCEVVPGLYLIYTLIRGAGTGWYPYPFLNPARGGGYGTVALYASGIAVTFLVVAWLLFTAGNKLRSRGRTITG